MTAGRDLSSVDPRVGAAASRSVCESFPFNAAGPGGDGAPFGSGRVQRDGTRRSTTADADDGEDVSVRRYVACGAEHTVPSGSPGRVSRLGVLRKSARAGVA